MFICPHLLLLIIACLIIAYLIYAKAGMKIVRISHPYVVYFLGVRWDKNQNRGASEKSINAQPKLKFQLKRNASCSSRDGDSEVNDGGLVAAGTEQERSILAEDAVCSICLARYRENEELRELPCSHFFHKDCVDKWLKIKALCPFCKFEIFSSNKNSVSTVDSNQQGC